MDGKTGIRESVREKLLSVTNDSQRPDCLRAEESRPIKEAE